MSSRKKRYPLSETCPNHGKVTPIFAFTQSNDGEIHMGARCPAPCLLWLRWVSYVTESPPKDVPLFPGGVRVELA